MRHKAARMEVECGLRVMLLFKIGSPGLCKPGREPPFPPLRQLLQPGPFKFAGNQKWCRLPDGIMQWRRVGEG